MFQKMFLCGALAAAALLAGCTWSQPYRASLGPRPAVVGGQLPPPATAKPQCAGRSPCLAFVEFDDYGNLMNRAQLEDTLADAREYFTRGGTVIVFVHGWHNSAQESSGELRHFRSLLDEAAKLQRNRRTPPVLGIFVAWRGDSIDKHGVGWLASYGLTFWDRKSAAHDIGSSGGPGELFLRLARMRNPKDDSRLILHGLSFGTAVIHSATTSLVAQQILDDGQGVAPEDQRPLADLVLLVNPAFEAMRLRPQLDLARRMAYPPDQRPRLVILTTEADKATSIAFPVGRFFGTFVDAYADNESVAQNKTAVGHYLPFITHQLTAEPCPQALARQGPQPLTAVRKDWCAAPVDVFGPSEPLVLRRCDTASACAAVAGDHYIARGDPATGLVPDRLPIMNIRTTAQVIGGHTDLDNPHLRSFIFRLVESVVSDPESIRLRPN